MTFNMQFFGIFLTSLATFSLGAPSPSIAGGVSEIVSGRKDINKIGSGGNCCKV